jgi:predicted acetyltransferase
MPATTALAVRPALAEDRTAIETMLKPYLVGLGWNGPYPRLESYWQDESRFPYLLCHGTEVIGFALVERLASERSHELVEFYIAPNVARQGFGREAANLLFARHRGKWVVRVRSDNAPGQAFWHSVLENHSPERTPTQSPDGLMYSFVLPPNEA